MVVQNVDLPLYNYRKKSKIPSDGDQILRL